MSAACNLLFLLFCTFWFKHMPIEINIALSYLKKTYENRKKLLFNTFHTQGIIYQII